LIAEYLCLLSTARWFRRSPDVTAWPPRWQEAHASDAEYAVYWRAKAMVVKEQIRKEVILNGI